MPKVGLKESLETNEYVRGGSEGILTSPLPSREYFEVVVEYLKCLMSCQRGWREFGNSKY